MPDTPCSQPSAQTIALFRYGLIAEFIHLPAGHRGLHALLRQKSEQTYVIPGSSRCRVAPETLRHWLKAWRRGGFDALLPKPRADIGQSRALPQTVADALLTLKEDQPHLSIPLLIQAVQRTPSDPSQDPTSTPAPAPLAPSTVHRLLSRAGLIGKGTAPSAPDEGRRRFAFEHPGQLWMSDVMHGPTVLMPDSRVRRKTYLIAFLDDATRVVPYCAFALSENTQAFLPVFKQALLRRGIPQRLYVDNGANYRSHQLAMVCARLGVALIHARPYQPQGKGKQERWFRTVRAQFLRTLGEADTASLAHLNQRLWAWVEGEYHHSPHRGLMDQTPLDRWALGSTTDAPPPRLPGPDLDDMFLLEARRRVQRDHTVSLNGTLFEIDAALVNQTVTLRYDPSLPLSRGVEVHFEGKFVERARVLDAYANCFVRRNHDSKTLRTTSASQPPTPGMNLRDLHQPHATDKEPR